MKQEAFFKNFPFNYLLFRNLKEFMNFCFSFFRGISSEIFEITKKDDNVLDSHLDSNHKNYTRVFIFSTNFNFSFPFSGKFLRIYDHSPETFC